MELLFLSFFFLPLFFHEYETDTRTYTKPKTAIYWKEISINVADHFDTGIPEREQHTMTASWHMIVNNNIKPIRCLQLDGLVIVSFFFTSD